MHVRPAIARIAISGTVLTASLAAITPAAHAGRDCDHGWHYEFVSVKDVHLPFPGLHYKDGKGGTISVEVTKSSSVSSQWGTTVEAEIGALFAKVKSNVTYSAVRETTSGIGHTYSKKISSKKYGHVRYGSWAKEVSWRGVYRWSNCREEVRESGVATVATDSHGFDYWETNS